MRWRQIVPTAVFSAWAAYTTLGSNTPLVPLLAAAIALYIGLRWVTTWAFRVRYWYPRQGRDSRTCRRCQRTIYRPPGDLLLHCYGCGRTPGWPLTRLFTRSVLVKQLRRTVFGPSLLVFLLVSAVLVAGVPGGGVGAGVDVNASGALSATEGPSDADYERAIHERVNEIRASEGVGRLEYSDELATVARGHSSDMAERDYFDHEAPDGVGVQARMRQAGIGCSAGENIARYERYATDPEDLAEQIVGVWMDSPPHRENLLQRSYALEGIGVHTNGREIWVTQNLC